MVRRAKTVAFDAKIYRHFAVVTLCLTAGLAIFADGENRSAIADEVEARERQAQLERAEVEKFGQPKLITAPTAHTASFDYGGSGGEFGAPMDGSSSSSFDVDYGPRHNTTSRVGTEIDYVALGLTKAEFDRLHPSEQQALLRDFRATRALQTRSLLEGSAARGGGTLEL